MPRPAKNLKTNGKLTIGKLNRASLGFEATLWQAAGKLRANTDSARLEREINANLRSLGYGG